MTKIQFNEKKFRELIVYIASKTLNEAEFGKTKMEKALWLTDFRCFKRTGSPATGSTYVKFALGPVPKAYIPILKKMVDDGSVVEVPCEIGGNSAIKVVSRREPDISMFSPEEISIADDVLDDLRCWTAKKISDLSHDFIGYRVAELSETIPYGTALFTGDTKALSPNDIEYGENLLDKIAV